ncbi:MAG TPA: polar amino acid ABC transporter permease, partial [Gordonia polyisoprenivorans]|nr:polar amino acid ABC transporter permease [Gordonia polyisoprenivorans]
MSAPSPSTSADPHPAPSGDSHPSSAGTTTPPVAERVAPLRHPGRWVLAAIVLIV